MKYSVCCSIIDIKIIAIWIIIKHLCFIPGFSIYFHIFWIINYRIERFNKYRKVLDTKCTNWCTCIIYRFNFDLKNEFIPNTGSVNNSTLDLLMLYDPISENFIRCRMKNKTKSQRVLFRTILIIQTDAMYIISFTHYISSENNSIGCILIVLYVQWCLIKLSTNLCIDCNSNLRSSYIVW